MDLRSFIHATASLGACSLISLVAGCSAQPGFPGREASGHTTKRIQKTTTTSVTVTPAPVAAAEPAPPPEPEPEPQGDTIVASASLRALCGIPDSVRAPRFAFDSAKVERSEDDLIAQVATCVKDGKLGDGVKLKLFGFTDPRGSEDYNMKLGRDRAESAKRQLVSAGVAGDRLLTESLGETAATGTDEESWARDRRVEIRLDRDDDRPDTGVGTTR